MPWQDDKDNGPRNPWGGPPPGGGGNPWGGGGRRGGGGGNRGGGDGPPPDLDALIKQAQENFRRIMPGDFGLGRALALVVAAAIGLWLASGFYFVQPNENAVVLTFGKFSKTEEISGLKYAFPWPIQQVAKVDVTTERRVEIGFNSGTQNNLTFLNQGQRGIASNDESLMLTGDENIIDIDFVVTWRVGKAQDFLFEIRNPEDTIKLVAESAMREIIGRTKITAALTEARGKVQTDARTLMQRVLDDYQSGVVVNNVQLLKVDPPSEVIDAFNDVQRARAEAEKAQNDATAYRNDIIPRARGQAQKTLSEAEAYKQEVIARAQGDADRFNQVFEAYRTSKDVTTERMYLETIEAILQNAKTIVLDDKGTQNALPYLPINELSRTPRAATQPAQP
jgi:membrane protease subunit HflK